jgi:hypothetical protein
MIICKMICVIQGILPSHYLRNVNLGNYGLAHVPESVTPECAFTPKVMTNLSNKQL